MFSGVSIKPLEEQISQPRAHVGDWRSRALDLGFGIGKLSTSSELALGKGLAQN